MSNSPLASYTKISPNKYVGRTYNGKSYKIDTITPHCVVGQVTVESLGNVFASPSRKASSNYGIGKDGKIGMYVEEKDTSWCSSSRANDVRAITIEIASDTAHPYAITDAAYKATVDLCTDICKRNGIKELKWKADKSLIGKVDQQNITVHRWLANKSCPGDYIYNRLGKIASEVNARLGATPSETTEGPFIVRVAIDDLNIRKGPGTNYAKTGQYTKKGAFTITEVKKGPGSTAGWGKLGSNAGWISLDFATRI